MAESRAYQIRLKISQQESRRVPLRLIPKKRLPSEMLWRGWPRRKKPPPPRLLHRGPRQEKKRKAEARRRVSHPLVEFLRSKLKGGVLEAVEFLASFPYALTAPRL